ncbi:pyridoxamine 5'-phosphate oxidase family protein [Sphingomonas sinipercae]|uniref:Pyridoxamine 5'-phosphate oxidase family protein n=2 Tax=Sphingomonas sinipercae TaxID=2714944 RepID=A0A6G7ZQT3_9SPHN|nr:pyridoxamine 5'-phosphate oxidase family protein [Sphingomonas sinipercae]
MSEAEQELREEFWDKLDDSPFVMLGLQGVDDAMTRPMTAQVDDGQIWFFAARSEDLVKGLGQNPKAIATYASKDHKLFASIHGTLQLSNDRQVIERLWNPIIASWYKDGKDDPDLALLRFDTTSADIWRASAGSTLKAAVIKMLGRDPGKQQQDENRAEVVL